MGIRGKLIVFLLGFGFVILGALLWSNQFVLHKTMLKYVDQRDQQRMERLKNNLEVYLGAKDINRAQDLAPEQWRRFLQLSHRIDLVENPNMIPFLLERPPRRRPPPLDEFEERVSFMTPGKQRVYGTQLEKTCVQLPIYRSGQLIAYIGYHPLQELTEQADIEFTHSQFKMLSLGAILITLLALILLWPLANHFLTPIRQLNLAMHRLAKGDLTGRLSVKRKDELGQLQRDFNYLATTLEAAQNSRNQWVAEISHELRTPLTILNGSIEAMVDGIRPLTADNLTALQKEVSLLQRLIEDLYQLSLSDVGALQYSMHRLNFSDLLAEVVDSFKSQAQQKSLSVNLSMYEGIWLEADENRLTQLLSNLLKNALAYTDGSPEKPGNIEVKLEIANALASLTIEDSSPSVSEDELQRLGERFYRTEPSRNRRTGGAGLGLAMVHKIVQAHQGSLALQHSDLGGLKVSIQLPLAMQAHKD